MNLARRERGTDGNAPDGVACPLRRPLLAVSLDRDCPWNSFSRLYRKLYRNLRRHSLKEQPVCDKVWDKVCDKVCDKVWDKVWDKVCDEVQRMRFLGQALDRACPSDKNLERLSPTLCRTLSRNRPYSTKCRTKCGTKALQPDNGGQCCLWASWLPARCVGGLS
jgi:hypothetical protein